MKKRTVFTAIAFILGIFLSLQIRSFQKIDLLTTRAKPGDIFAEMRVLQIANAELRAQLEEEEKALSEMKSALANRALEESMDRLRILSGEEPVAGEGIEITFPRSVKEFWLTDLIAQLVSSGAEAVALNDIRLTEQTAGFRDLGTGLLMRKYFFKPPIRLSVIGPRKELKQSVAQEGGILKRMEKAHPGLKITVEEKEKIVMPVLLR